jgi:hypothetical protein
MRYRRLFSLILLTSGAFAGSFQIAEAPSGAANTGELSRVALQSLVVSNFSGFTSESTDRVGGGPTGKINFNEAKSADCDPAGLSRTQWVSSVLRYFDNSSADPETYLLLCVTQLRTAHDAAVNFQRVSAISKPSGSLGTQAPGALHHSVGPANQIFFAKGDYFVWIVATSLSPTVKALVLGTSLAHRQYIKLPK